MTNIKNKIKIKDKEFFYEPEYLSYENSVIIDKEIAKENLLLFAKLAKENNFFFLLFYGTLLGAIREKDFISHDIDIDLVTNDENKLLEFIPHLLENDFKFIRYESNKSLHSFTTLYSFRRKSVYIDVYIAYKEYKKYNLLGSYIKRKYIDDTIIKNFLGYNFTIPKANIELLEILYGVDWMIPIQNKPGDFPKSELFSQKIFQFIKITIKKIIPKKVYSLMKYKFHDRV